MDVLPQGGRVVVYTRCSTAQQVNSIADQDVVREIFSLAATTGYTGVAEYLNERGISGPKGGLWNSSSLRDILLNPAYAGDLVFNRTHKGR